MIKRLHWPIVLSLFLDGIAGNFAKSLSENQYLGKDQLSAGQLKKGEIILTLFLPANQESARTIEPGMAAFYHPTAGTIARDELFLAFLFTATADVWLIVACEEFLVDGSGVVGSIQA